MTNLSSSERTADLDILDLRVEYESGPINVPPAQPRFSWRAETDERGARQTAYRILVARSERALAEERGDIWDSGIVDRSDATVVFDGAPLASDTDYWWTVRIWNERGRPSEWAEPASFSTALAHHEWKGDWIGYRPDPGDSNGYRSRWRSPSAGATEWVQIDLGEVRKVEEIELYPADPFDGPETPDGMAISAVYSTEEAVEGRTTADGPSGFGFPVRYRVEVSDDPNFEDARTVVDRTETDQPAPGTDPVSLAGAFGGARYVRIVATELYEFDPATPAVADEPKVKLDFLGEEHRPWCVFALAAVAVRNSEGKDLASGRAVTASSSVESEGWGRTHLVDGEYESRTAPESPHLRTEVDLSADVERAHAHVCTLGYGELYVNGERVGDDVLNPGWTQYDERVLYSTYDVTDRLSAGRNALGLWLGRGWFDRNAQDWTGFGAPRAIVLLNVEYADGTTRTITTDGSWRASESAITENDIYDGERYDARREQPRWARPAFDGEWDDVSVVAPPGGDLVPQRMPPIRVTETIDPVEIRRHDEGPIVDFGQNLVGWIEVTIDGAKAGDEIELRHAEVLRDDGGLSMIDLRSADAIDTYIAKGEDRETYHPRFTYHGFRYAQIVGYPGDLDAANVCAKVVHTDVDPIGSFECSNEELSRVQRNAEWSLRGNLHSVLTDCPQRDERLGWTGDNHIAARALMYNFDAALFYEKWMDDHDDVQSEHGYVADTIPFGYGTIPEDPTWGITRVTVPWHLYQHYGDVGVLERHYEGMRRYVDYWYDQMNDGVIPDEYGNYGDWLAFENTDGRCGLPYDLFNTAFQYHTTDLFARIADALGFEQDAESYAARADEIADAFDRDFFDPDAGRYGPGTQSSYAVALFVGLVPDEHIECVVDNLVEKVRADGRRLRTGFLGTRPLIHALVDHGHEELAYEIVSQPACPGWVYMVRQGATTMWERWDSDDRVGTGMNSFNHSPFSFVSEWFYYAIAGIRFDRSMSTTGDVEIAPAVVDDLEWATGSVRTGEGTLSSAWERTDDGYALEIRIPWNMTATVRLPVPDPNSASVVADGSVIWNGAVGSLPKGITDAGRDDERVALTVGAGTYRFEIQ